MRWPVLGPTVRLRHVATLEPPAGLDCLGSVSIGPAGEAVALWTDPAGLEALYFGDPDDGDYPGPMAGSAAVVGVTVDSPARVQTVVITGVRGVRPVAQPLPNGRVLLVGWSAEWRPEGFEKNATIFGPAGEPQLSASVGDAAGQVRATLDGSVWVGYDDMGINGGPGEPPPLGERGLVRFAPDLTVEWQFPGDDVPQETLIGLSLIDDCEAIALADDGHSAWVYYYSSFPVVRIGGDQRLRAWLPLGAMEAVPVGVLGLASDGRHVALAGAPARGARDRVVLARLDADGWTRVRRPRLLLPDGSRLPATETMAGFGDVLHVFVGNDWYQVTMAELL